MKPGTRITPTPLAALLLSLAMLPAYASESSVSFKEVDADKNGFLSLDEFKEKDMDDLAFRAADINGDGQVDPDEYDNYLTLKAGEQPGSESGPGGQAKPAQPAPGY
jgi:Ca2+-binding EF-hand superfamily protein